MRELRTDIDIEASPARVWAVLTDFERYTEWNPFVREISGDLREGAKLEVHLGPPGKSVMTFKPEVKKVEAQQTLRWLGHLLIPGLFDGEHIFELESLGENSTRFIQREEFQGILVGLFWRNLDTDIRMGFAAMNEALKKRVEENTG